jgi:hypothetical protein
MTSLSAKIATFVATSALVLSVVPGVLAADVDVTVADNGAGSHQGVLVVDGSSTTVQQSSTTNVVSIQNSTASTGGDSITNSTGAGDPSITTGNASATNKLTVEGGSSVVVPDTCGCDPSTVTVDVSGNGAHAKTGVAVVQVSKKKTTQQTNTNVFTVQNAKAKTGNNKIKNSTGSDGNSINTGNATTKNKVTVVSGSNFVGPAVAL